MSKTPYQYINLVGKNLQSGINQLEKTNVGYINVRQLGAVGDGITDDSAKFSSDAKGYIANDGTFALTKDKLFEVLDKPLLGNGYIKYNEWYDSWIDGRSGLLDGKIPFSKLNDKIFMSMALPSDATSGTTRGDRRNGYIGYKPDATYHKVNSMGAAYPIVSSFPSDTVTICVGKLRTMGYSKKKGQWIELVATPHPRWWGISNNDWSGWLDSSGVVVTEHSDYTEYVIPSSTLANGIFHYDTGDMYVFDETDIEYLISYEEAWTDEAGKGKLLLAGGSDLRNANSGASATDLNQAIFTRFVVMDTVCKYCIGHNIPSAVYDSVVTDPDKLFYQLSATVNESIEVNPYTTVYMFPPNKANADGGDDIWFLKVPKVGSGSILHPIEIAIDIYHPRLSKAHAIYKIDLMEVNNSFASIGGSDSYSSAFELCKVENVAGVLSGKIKAVYDSDTATLVFYVTGLSNNSGERIAINVKTFTNPNPSFVGYSYNSELITQGVVANPNVSKYPSLTDITALKTFWQS